MSLRFRLGPFTFGRGGTRLSLWGRGGGVSIPLSGGKGRIFGKIAIGPFRWFFAGSPATPTTKQVIKAQVKKKPQATDSYPEATIKAFGSDRQFLEKLRCYGLPWRGVQERLKEELPENLIDPDNIAYSLVPKAMDAVFGKQNTAWMTEKRPSKSDNGLTTWIVIIK
jgi:hypothetical protein